MGLTSRRDGQLRELYGVAHLAVRQEDVGLERPPGHLLLSARPTAVDAGKGMLLDIDQLSVNVVDTVLDRLQLERLQQGPRVEPALVLQTQTATGNVLKFCIYVEIS